nr:hypothetical protein [Tanacetum cinerariifolium]
EQLVNVTRLQVEEESEMSLELLRAKDPFSKGPPQGSSPSTNSSSLSSSSVFSRSMLLSSSSSSFSTSSLVSTHLTFSSSSSSLEYSLSWMTVDSSRTPGEKPVPLLEPPVHVVFCSKTDSIIILACVAWTYLAASSSASSAKLIDFPNSKAMSGLGMTLSSIEIECEESF